MNDFINKIDEQSVSGKQRTDDGVTECANELTLNLKHYLIY